MKYFDAHCHVQFDKFDSDRDEVVAKMREREVGGVVVGCDLETSRLAVELAEKHEHLWASVGLHPNDNATEEFNMDAYRELAKSKKVVAIGECGLDYFRSEPSEATKEKQYARLTAQIALATELDKPLIIHSRPSKGTQDAYHDLIKMLTAAKKEHPTLRGDIHFFVGGVDEMRELIALGFTVSYTAVITFAREYDSTIKAAPLTSILSETDSPYVPPMSRAKGSRNDPLAVEDVVVKIAEIRGEEVETVRAALVENAKRMFKLS
jgi:TatD DNase family protein